MRNRGLEGRPLWNRYLTCRYAKTSKQYAALVPACMHAAELMHR